MAASNIILTNLAGIEFQDTNNANVAILVKSAGGTLFVLHVDNSANGGQIEYVKLWDSIGAVTVGTTPPDWVFKIPGGAVLAFVMAPPEPFSTGLQVATVTAGGTGGAVSPTSPVIVRIVYS